MKSIYTINDGAIYQMLQDVTAPITDVKTITPNSVNQTNDPYQKITKASLYFSDFDFSNIKSNKENADTIIDFIKDNGITEIDKVYDSYTVAVDYTVYDSSQKEIEHSVIIKPIKSTDFVYPLGVNAENECVYRRIKHLQVDLDWMITDTLPYGIMCTKNKRTTISINDVSIYQDKFKDEDVSNHPSIYSKSYNCKSCTINTALENKIPVYSTRTEGIEIQPIVNDFKPRIINLSINLDLTKIIVIYNDEVINSILTENIKLKNNSNDVLEVSTPNDTNTSSTTEAEKTIVYERSTVDNALSLKVVEDEYPDDDFDSSKMVHKSDVISDISDIEVGDYVIKTNIVND
jgi:hypothetical protein